ncbi:hypothetical protein KR222_004935 [Zaprionus bogoriensis]|nr:hypothetical protein KR222_004935 [Zaprionus bogoriensis]
MDDDDETKKRPTPEIVVQLSDGQVGETETDDPLPRHVSFELPSTSLQTAVEHSDFDEATALVTEMIESILPEAEPKKVASISTLLGEVSHEPEAGRPTTQPPYEDARLHRILRLLDRYTRNLEAIEELMLGNSRELPQSTDPGELSGQQEESETEIQVTQYCELATQTLPLNTLCLNVTSTIRPKKNRRIAWEEQQQGQQSAQQLQSTDSSPPCERRHHVITISANSSTPFAPPAERRSFLNTVGHTLGDFAAAFCLCFQVNKDCIFCLGFFIAFVISASFLTAFFYRTISLSTTPVRVPIDAAITAVPQTSDVATLRFNGGYYYVYNSHRQHFV